MQNDLQLDSLVQHFYGSEALGLRNRPFDYEIDSNRADKAVRERAILRDNPCSDRTAKRSNKLDFPTPESPMSTILYR